MPVNKKFVNIAFFIMFMNRFDIGLRFFLSVKTYLKFQFCMKLSTAYIYDAK